jgi:hypothetical protein
VTLWRNVTITGLISGKQNTIHKWSPSGARWSCLHFPCHNYRRVRERGPLLKAAATVGKRTEMINCLRLRTLKSDRYLTPNCVFQQKKKTHNEKNRSWEELIYFPVVRHGLHRNKKLGFTQTARLLLCFEKKMEIC